MSEVFPQFKYTFRLDGQPMSYAIQSAYIGSNYAYALIHASKKNSYLYRGVINPDSSVINLSSDDKMILKNFGHDQSLTFYQHYNQNDGQVHDYFLTTMRCNTNSEQGWGTQIGRIEYQNGPIDYTQCSRLSNIGSLVSDRGSLDRCEVASNADQSNMIIYAQPNEGPNHKWVTLALVDFNAVNNKWDQKTPHRYINIAPFIMDKYPINTHNILTVSDHSMQGMAISNGDKIYITSGQQDKNVPHIFTFKWGDHFSSSHTFGGKNEEAEAPHIHGQDLYLDAVAGHDSHKYNRIYAINKYDV